MRIPRSEWGCGMGHKTITGGLMPGGRLRMEKLAALDERYPEIIRLCARESAKVERRLWAQQEAESESDLRAAGIEVTELDEEEKARFRAAVQPMYDRFAQQGELITRIRQA